MCGRAAQTQHSVMAAASSLKTTSERNVLDRIGPRVSISSKSKNSDNNQKNGEREPLERQADGAYPWHDNYNMSPGHDAVVFSIGADGEIVMTRKTWGLVVKRGSSQHPIEPGPSKHFANLLFNARSDTLFSKPTFAKLLNEGKTCLIAFDGFYEWKADALGGGKGRKQPYFVFRRNNEDGNKQSEEKSALQPGYLLMAGLWTSVPTGYTPPQPDTLDTFTILTTEVCDSLQWLHSRMPVCVWNEQLALQWLKGPSQSLLKQIDMASHNTPPPLLQWHAVSTQMSSTKYRSADAMKAIPKLKSVKSFFSPVKNEKDASSTPKTSVIKVPEKEHSYKSNTVTTSTKEKSSNEIVSSFSAPKRTVASPDPDKGRPTKKSKVSTPAKPKKGSITSFFSPKKQTKQ